MNNRLQSFIVSENDTIVEALRVIDSNRQGFAIVTDNSDTVIGVLSDGDIRRGILKGVPVDEQVAAVYTKNPKTVSVSAGFVPVVELFKNETIKFLPIVDEEGHLVNIITKNQLHTMLLLDIHTDLTYDFFSLDTNVVNQEIFPRPWGFYKTTVLNDFYQAKVISVQPGGQLSLQSHNHREEHWIVVHGSGVVQLDQSVMNVSCGSSVFIPKGAKHRLTNTDEKESLIISEVQIGDYLGEDDIIRYEDVYGRV